MSRPNRAVGGSAPNQVQGEYIKVLQDEVKILEYELRLLKEKEHEHSENGNRDRKFFADGVPINPNILTLKTQFKQTQDSGNKELELLHSKKQSARESEADLRTEIARLEARRKDLEAEVLATQVAAQSGMEALVSGASEAQQSIERTEKELATLLAETKRLKDENIVMFRTAEREKLLAPAKEENQKQEFLKLSAKLRGLEEKKRENELLLESTRSKTKPLSAQLSDLEGKLARIEREIGSSESRSKEIAIQLDTKRRERAHEWLEKRTLVNEIEAARFRLEEIGRLSDAGILLKAKEKEEAERAELIRAIDIIKQEKDMVVDKRRAQDSELEKLDSEKSILSDQISAIRSALESSSSDFSKEAEYLVRLKDDAEVLRFRESHVTLLLDSLTRKSDTLSARIPPLRDEISHYEKRLSGLNKQIEFAKQLKMLNINDAVISDSANAQVNANLKDFISKVEDIRRKFADR